MGIMDRQDYISKANTLLNQNTYRSISWDPTNTNKNKHINILTRVNIQTGLSNQTYKAMYPTGCIPQVLWPSQDQQARHSPHAYCVKLWVGHIWGGKGTCQNLKTIS